MSKLRCVRMRLFVCLKGGLFNTLSVKKDDIGVKVSGCVKEWRRKILLTDKYSNNPSLVPEASFTQSGAESITPAPASFSSGRYHLHNETLPQQRRLQKHENRQSRMVYVLSSSLCTSYYEDKCCMLSGQDLWRDT